MTESTSHVVIRAAGQLDVPVLVPMLLAQLGEHGIPAQSDHVAAQVAGTIASPEQGFVLLAEDGGAAVGVAYVSFARPLEHAGEVAWLEELYVAPAARNHGVGQRLLAEVCARAEVRGCVAVDLEVTADHARAANLYERSGFRSLRRAHYTRPLSNWDWGTS